MTIFPIKWRANEQLGGGWAPTSQEWPFVVSMLDFWWVIFQISQVYTMKTFEGKGYTFTKTAQVSMRAVKHRNGLKQWNSLKICSRMSFFSVVAICQRFFWNVKIPKIGEDETILTNIFFKGVETTN